MHTTVKVAVSEAAYGFDKPYDYLADDFAEKVFPGARVLVPFGRGNRAREGFVLAVDTADDLLPRLKPILYSYGDDLPLSKEQISLALWMRSRYFGSFFEYGNSMLPPGIWKRKQEKYRLSEGYTASGGLGERELAIITALSDKPKKELSEKEITALSGIANPRPLVQELIRAGIVEVSSKTSGTNYNRTIKAVSLACPNVDPKLLGRGKALEKRLAAIEFLKSHGETFEKELCYQTGASSVTIRDLIKKGVLSERLLPAYMAETPLNVSSEPYSLSLKQHEVFQGLWLMAEKREPCCALLRGVTGSGKTAIYIELIRKTIESGHSALLLVPEIALTPRMMREFKGHFGSRAAIMHSNLSPSTRYDEYMKIKNGHAMAVVGTRSAVFAPCAALGLIIIDEEHENTYISDSGTRYSAIDVAKYRCGKSQCLLLLGSATPSVESYYKALNGQYSLFTLDERFNEANLPKTIISDMKQSLKSGNGRCIGDTLKDEIQKNLDAEQQTILFINRRGNSKMAVCAECGYIPQCENCSISLTYHSANGRLMCHHCGYSVPLMEKCPMCGSSHITLVGAGTQKIESEISELFPNAQVLRMDTDTTTGRRSHEEILDIFEKGGADILLGTQMVAKGLDFPNVTLVGVIDADSSAASSGYMANERNFSLISQVVGRAGRRDKPGRAVIQSFSPQNPIIEAASMQDYEAFYKYEITVRELIGAPPFKDIFTFLLSCENEERATAGASVMAKGLKAAFAGPYAQISSAVLGPVPAPIARLNGKYRYTVSFKGADSKLSRKLMREMLSWFACQNQSKGITVSADINIFNI